MAAHQKAALAELVISLVAILGALIAYPWLGHGAMGVFGVLGLLGLIPLFLRKRTPDQIVFDERDNNIAMRATFFGMGTAWMALFMSIVVLTVCITFETPAVPNGILSLVLWVSFALCYAVKGGVALHLYRTRAHAA